MTIQPCPPQFKGQTISPADMANWARQAGFSGPDLTTIVAIGIAESHGHTDAKNTNLDGSTDYGVWQINSVHADLFDKWPEWWSVTNANMAHALFTARKNSFDDWVTYKNGTYQMYMGQAGSAALNPGAATNTSGGPDQTTTTNIIPGVDAIASSLSAFSTGFAAMAKWMSDVHNWERVGLVFIGGALVVGALVMLTGKEISAPLENVTGKVLRAAV